MSAFWFYLHGDPDAQLRLKAFSSSSRGGRFSIRIEVETDDPAKFGFALADLVEVQKGQKAKPAPKKPAQKLLALPAPEKGE
jgi:hypothetical protein